MMSARSSAPRRRGLAVAMSAAAVASLVVAHAQQAPARPAAPAGQAAAPAAPATPPGTLPPPTRAIVPVAASSVAAKPDQWVGEYVAMTGVVEQSLGKLAFTVDQDKAKAAPEVLVLASRMSDPVAANTYVTVIGLLMKYDAADVAAKSKAHGQDLAAIGDKYKGKPVVLATSIVNDKMLDLARFIPPPMTPDEEGLQKAMRGLPGASGELRKGADGSNVELATKNVAALAAAFAETEAFMKKRGKLDAVKMAADARANVLAVEKAAKAGAWDDAKKAAAAVGGACGACHTPYRERLEDGSFRFKAGS